MRANKHEVKRIGKLEHVNTHIKKICLCDAATKVSNSQIIKASKQNFGNKILAKSPGLALLKSVTTFKPHICRREKEVKNCPKVREINLKVLAFPHIARMGVGGTNFERCIIYTAFVYTYM